MPWCEVNQRCCKEDVAQHWAEAKQSLPKKCVKLWFNHMILFPKLGVVEQRAKMKEEVKTSRDRMRNYTQVTEDDWWWQKVSAILVPTVIWTLVDYKKSSPSPCDVGATSWNRSSKRIRLVRDGQSEKMSMSVGEWCKQLSEDTVAVIWQPFSLCFWSLPLLHQSIFLFLLTLITESPWKVFSETLPSELRPPNANRYLKLFHRNNPVHWYLVSNHIQADIC